MSKENPNAPVEWFLEFLPIAAAWTRDGRTVESNPHAVQLLGVPATAQSLPEWATSIAARVIDLDHPEAVLRDVLAGTAVERRGVTVRRPDGQQLRMHLHAYPAIFPDGQVGAVTLFEGELPEADFGGADVWLGALAHELAGTAQSMALNLELLRRDLPWSEKSEARLTSMEATLGVVRRIITDYIDAARAPHGNLRCRPAEVELGPVLEQARELHQQVDPEHQIVVTAAEDLVAFADETWVVQILRNLLSNAQKYSAPGMLKVDARRDGDELIVRLQDEGPGIAPELQRLLFRRYARLPSAREGTGLGLWLSRRLSRRMDGDLWVESDGGSTAFVLALPAAASPLLQRRWAQVHQGADHH